MEKVESASIKLDPPEIFNFQAGRERMKERVIVILPPRLQDKPLFADRKLPSYIWNLIIGAELKAKYFLLKRQFA